MATTDDRTTAWSAQLAQAHRTLRRQLRDVRGRLGVPGTGGNEVLTHCLGFCSALATHHGGEDQGLFAELLRIRPDLEQVVANLVQDHQMIAVILASVRALALEAGNATSERLESIGRELDGLAAIVESHFGYEERAIGDILDGDILDGDILGGGLEDTGWTTPVFGLTAG